MNRTAFVALVSPVVLMAAVCPAQEGGAGPRAAELERVPQDLEARFALSAFPPHLRASATVYLLDPRTGYLPQRKGDNGFSCIVERTEWARGISQRYLYGALLRRRGIEESPSRLYGCSLPAGQG